MKNEFNESFSSNLVFLRENRFLEDWLNFENALFLSAHFKILVTVGKKINIQGWSVLKGGPSVECATFYLNLGWTLIFKTKSRAKRGSVVEILSDVG